MIYLLYDINSGVNFTKDNKVDKNYGVRYTINENWAIGNSELKFLEDDFEIKGIIYKGTPGLYELLFMKEPELKKITQKGLESCKSILMLTNAHRRFYADNEQIKGTRAIKYTTIIRNFFKDNRAKVERLEELDMRDIEYVYWDDPNELVERLRFFMSSPLIGHYNHFNEICAIIDSLKRVNIIE